MSGTLPQSMSSLQSLRTLGLGETRIHGPLDAVFSLRELVAIDAWGSRFDGTIPSFKELRNLVILKLFSNLLCGEIPDDIGNAESLNLLELHSNQLNGTLPLSLKKLHVLRSLNVAYNFFVGDIEVVASLPLLSTLNLAFNTFRGTIPSMFGSMSNLQELQLAHNNLSGTLPSALSTSQSLIAADLSYNQLEGELPPEYGNMTALRNFSAAGNSLRGGVPGEWCGMPLDHLDLSNTATNTSLESLLLCFRSMRVLRLGRTTVTGPLWQQPFVTSKLVELNISNCSVAAPLPEALPSLLVVFDGSYNSFIGALPASWATAPLRLVALDRSNISGTLPESWATLSNLMELHLKGNSVSGTLPSGWGALSNLMQLHLDGNSISGTLPSAWVAMSQLRTVAIASNSLSGSLPPQWSNLKQVDRMLLSGNFLSGALPASWGILTVQVLVLSNNSLTGSLPDSWGSMRLLALLDLSVNEINGTLPAAWSLLPNPVIVLIHHNRLSGGIPPSWVTAPTYILTLHNNLLDAPLVDMLPMFLYVLTLNENRILGSLPSNWGFAMKPPLPLSRARREDVDALLMMLPELQRLLDDGSAHVFFNLSCNQLVGAVPSSWAPLLQAEPPAVSLCNNFIENTSYSQRALLNCAVNLSAPVSPVANITFIARSRATNVASLGVAVAAVGLVNYGGAAAMGMRSIFVYQAATRCLEGQQSLPDGGDTESPNDVSGDLMGISVGPLDACRFHRGAVVGDFALVLSVATVGLSASVALITRRILVTGIGTEVSWAAKYKLLWKAAAVLKLPGILVVPCSIAAPLMASSAVALLTMRCVVAADVVLATVALLLVLALLSVVAVLLFPRFGGAARPCVLAPSPQRPSVSRLRVALNRAAVWVVQRRDGVEWVDKGCTSRPKAAVLGFVDHYGALFEAYRVPRRWYLLVDLGTSLCAAAVDGSDAGSTQCSRGSSIANLVIMSTALTALAVLQPNASRFDALWAVVITGCGVVCTALVVARCDGCLDVAASIGEAQLWLSVAQGCCALLQVTLLNRGSLTARLSSRIALLDHNVSAESALGRNMVVRVLTPATAPRCQSRDALKRLVMIICNNRTKGVQCDFKSPLKLRYEFKKC